MTIGLAPSLRANRLDEITTRAGSSARLRIYMAPRPATGAAVNENPPPTGLLLAQLTCNATFANPANQTTGGPLTLLGIATQTSAAGTDAAAWFRIYQSNGTTHVLDGSVSTIAAATGDLQLDDINIVAGGTVAISAAEFTEGNA